jgi:VWFA-related protein
VVLHATVQDHKGTPVSGLGKDDFQVYEDGALQQIEYYSHEDIAAAMAFARSSNPQDQMFVVNFNEYVSFGLPANTPFTDQAAKLQIALSRFNPTGETALYDALAAGLEHLKKGNRDKKVLIVVSDGGDNASKCKLGQVLAMAGQSDAIIYTIGIYTEEDPD